MTSCEYPYLERYVTILSTPEELSIPLDSIDSLSNSNGTNDESTNSDAPDQNNSLTNNLEVYAFDDNELTTTNSSDDVLKPCNT